MSNYKGSGAEVKPIKRRIETLDALRGFALIGIYLSIIHGFNSPSPHSGEDFYAESGALDDILSWASSLFINKRFIGIFSLLFGIGIAIQQQNFIEKGKSFTPYFTRRMMILACLGIINTTFFFSVEILLVYAIFGLVALALSRIDYRITLSIAFFFYLIWGQYFEMYHRDDLIAWFQWFNEQYPFERMSEIFTHGPLLEQIKLNWIKYLYVYTDNGFHLGMSISMILIGYVIGKEKYHTNFLRNLKNYRKAFNISILYTVAFTVFAIAAGQTDFIFMYDPIAYFFYAIFMLASMFAYIYLIAWWHDSSKGNNIILKALTANGRLSLTGYMGGAFVYSVIFYSHGFGFYMKLNGTQLAGIALLAYLGFSLFASVWLKKFRQGPLEWFNRRLAHGKL